MSFSVRLLCVLGFVAVSGVRLSQQGPDPARHQPSPRPGPRIPVASTNPRDQIVLDYGADRTITINAEVVAASSLRPRLRSLYRARADRTLWVAGDGSLKYGEIADVIEATKEAGVERVGVITPGMRKSRIAVDR
jgi:biopolymer transport protein TolR